jgi:hypothetical protein
VNDQLQNLGFLIAHDKYHCSPCQKLDWLGYTWDTVNGLIFFKEERIQNLEKCEKGKKMLLNVLSSITYNSSPKMTIQSKHLVVILEVLAY